ncbi:MAG TPA: hypothetical protein VGE13_03960 [Candidatus Saccharimonadales bacterium]
MQSNPNHAPNTTVELSPEERSVFSLAKINEWRAQEYAALANLYDSSTASASFAHLDRNNVPEYVRQFNESVDGLLDAFLVENGIDTSSPNYAEVRQLFYEARIGTGDGDGISGVEWDIAPASRGGDPGDTKSQSDIFRERIEQRIGVDTNTPSDPDMDPRGELNDDILAEAYLENTRFDVGKTREAWATASAKRQGRAFSMKKDKNRDTLKDKYHKSVQKLGIMELEDQISDNDSDAEKNAKVIAWLFDEQAKLRELTTEKLQGTKVGRFVNFMNKGSRKARFMKAVGLGVVAGVGGSLLAGAAGAAAIAVGAAGASRFVRGYVRGDGHRGMMTAQEEFGDNPVELENVQPHDTTEHLFDAAAEQYNEAFENDTKLEQKKRKKALIAGVGAVALGTGIGWAVSHVGVLGDAKDAIHDKFFGDKLLDKDNDYTPNNGPGNETDGGSEPKPWAGRDADGDGILNGQDLVPHDSDIAFDVSDISHEARWVEPGEGWYQTFQDLGIPQDHWSDVLQDAGPKLQEQGWAYKMDDGTWGISHPGSLSNESLRIIAKAAKRDGFTLAA